ncbi:MAG: sodium/solute symporter [Planctomycetales bacterium]|nr:sodium/solute symporter [Planctomycetales bacterium]
MTLGLIDTLVLLLSIALVVWIGLRVRSTAGTVEGFLLGDRNLPWWAILGSIVATETSTATVLSLPATAYGPVGMKFLQIAFGYILGRSVVVYFLLPAYFDGKIFSAYQVLERRFGGSTKQFASILFLVTRNLGDGLRLFLASVVLWKLLGWSLAWSAIAIGAITIFYTYFGGMRSIVWNDCIQFLIYMLGGIVTILIIGNALPNGWQGFWEFAAETGKLEVFQFAPPADSATTWGWLLNDAYSFWAGLIGGAVLTLGTHGTDQMMVQRYLSARSQTDAARALWFSGVVVCIQFALFLFIGVLLASFYADRPEVVFEKSDEVYAHFIVHSFPKNTGMIGLMLAAILAAAMSTLSSSLNASASALLNDFYLPMQKDVVPPERVLQLTRYLAVGFGVLQVLIGIWAGSLKDTVVSNSLTIAGFSAGILLGLFTLGNLTNRVGQTAALAGSLLGLACLLFVQFAWPSVALTWWPDANLKIAWPWFALIGSMTTFTCALAVSYLPGCERKAVVATNRN